MTTLSHLTTPFWEEGVENRFIMYFLDYLERNQRVFEDEETSNQSPKNYFLNNLAMWIWMYINGSTLYLIDCVDRMSSC